jgi:hypothetical protein
MIGKRMAARSLDQRVHWHLVASPQSAISNSGSPKFEQRRRSDGLVGMAGVDLPTAIGGRRCLPDRRSRVDRLELYLHQPSEVRKENVIGSHPQLWSCVCR